MQCECQDSAGQRYKLPQGPGTPDFRSDCKQDDAEVRFYYITSVTWDATECCLYQKGCGLNLRTDVATLCTCKREMVKCLYKLRRDNQERPLYVGALSSKAGRPEGAKTAPMIFLGKIDRCFDSFETLWEKLPQKVRNAKSVCTNYLGDLYPPKLVRKKILHESDFCEGHHAHFDNSANPEYLKDLNSPYSLIFTEWRAWPKGVELSGREVPKEFEDLIQKGRPSRYGFIFKLRQFETAFSYALNQ